jgi:glycine/D-amino acid oxidase-like deaminating enzyme
MKIAILGAGFAGLSAAWHLLQKAPCEVIIYDPRGIGGGASGIATGLMHPYTGEQGRRSVLASEGIAASKKLIQTVEQTLNRKICIQQGILRYVQNEEQRRMFLGHSQTYGDVQPLSEDCFWVESGMTIDCPLYLQGLWQLIEARGARLIREEITDLSALEHFDKILIAAGAGAQKFSELNRLQTSLVKGQVLRCQAPSHILPRASSISKGYIALSHEPGICFVGSTYEREDLTDQPNVALAQNQLFEKVGAFFPDVQKLRVIDCKAALRLGRKGHYLPYAEKISDRLYVFTALGSRGLLYHAHFGSSIANEMF